MSRTYLESDLPRLTEDYVNKMLEAAQADRLVREARNELRDAMLQTGVKRIPITGLRQVIILRKDGILSTYSPPY